MTEQYIYPGDPLAERIQKVADLTEKLPESNDEQYEILVHAINIIFDSCEIRVHNKHMSTPSPADGNRTIVN